MSAARFYNDRSCNDDYVPRNYDCTFTSSTRDENADEPWSPTMRMKHTGRPQPPFTSELYNRVPVDNSSFTRSTCEPNELEKRNFTNENRACISQYTDANIQFRDITRGEFTWALDARFVPDAKLEALDAMMEKFYSMDIVMELTLSEPEDYVRPDFDYEGELEEYLIYDDSGEMTPRGRIITNYDSAIVEDDDYDDDHYEEFSRSDRFCDECEECGEKFSNFLNSDVCEKCYETLINIE